MTIFLAVDPGGTCGMASVQIGPGVLFNADNVHAWQLQTNECIDWCRYYIGADWVVFMERFFITTHTAQLSPEGTHKTLDVIGTVKSLCRWAGAGFVFQSKNDAAKLITNEQLKSLELWQPNADHARDALRHLIYGIVNNAAGEACENLKQRLA